MPEEGKTVVTHTLPSAARSRINLQVELNEQNQVISAGNQRLGAIDPKSLLESYRNGNKAKVVNGTDTTIDSQVSNKVISAASKQKNKLGELDNATGISEIDLDEL